MTNEKKQPDNVLISYLNINSPRFRVLGSKFLPYHLAISETKINEEFPNSSQVRKRLICKKLEAQKMQPVKL